MTARGPHMYIPGTANSHYKTASTVTVSQTTSLVNQMVQVSWTGFTPSSQPTYDNTSTDYPVMVAQCKGTNPANPSQCYDATNGGTPASFGANGPGNTAYATTDANGTGKTDILLFTSVQNQFLGCDPKHPCSLVVVPSQGGDSLNYATPNCNNHGQDSQSLDLGQYAFLPSKSSPFSPNGYCSWKNRIVIPLYFAPTPNGCPLRAADFTAGGSPMLADAMTQWQTGMCQGGNSVELQYNSSINESEARTDVLSGLNDVAFTTQPVTGTGKHPYTYAPVAVSATSIAYWVDNSVTGQPKAGIKLDPRLVAKLLTTSYNFSNEGCPQAARGPFGCDNAVDNNPLNLYADPEFRKLNPSVWRNAAQPSGYEIPTVVSGNSDMTWVTTSWIAADKDAAGFLTGQFDPWGMHVNTYYLGVKYPTDSFLPMDPYFPLSSQYSPVYPLATVSKDQAENIQPGTMDTRDTTTGNYDALPPQVPGNRDLWAITDQAGAARFLFPTAAIQNHAGKYIQPTMQSMAAAVKDMTVNPDGITRSVNYSSNDPAAYPLTMVIYAVVPTGGISATKAAKIAQFLDFVASQGQQTGTSPGNLAPGYLPLPQSLRQQTLAAAYKVLHQTGNSQKPAGSGSPSHSPSASASASASPSKPASASPSASGSASRAPTAHAIAISFSHPDATGMSWIVLALLIAGAVLILAGPGALVYASPAARAAIGSGARRIRRLGNISRNRPGASRPRRGRVSRRIWRRNP
ncbi:MAG TPA: hypothetical protein VE733_23750 [Streptosporangiaceae bacterium]|nr:hypothetical protein [Streptosporangiaceae bacterium]